MNYLKIDEVAKQTGLTKRTIRYYEEIGILPELQRTEGGTRLYTQADIEFLKKVMNAKEVLGFTLQEIQKYVAISDALETKKQIYRNANNDQDQKEKLKRMVEVLDRQLELIDQKFVKIQNVKKELEDLRTRARNKIIQLS
ncbi:MerR family transcriptional regulator [Neobacillus pocheonensis]|jgi:MerR family transcriptional regulator, repressor of the yfmOP operon|uniref:MerR family transcriptional regulator n=1 Tax=Neobacillus pocheonensis TaxID=363869 RepID=A0ABT0W972_9BACI|nr:MerR family transcriptional regulator [Neobacillus pocheonensis]